MQNPVTFSSSVTPPANDEVVAAAVALATEIAKYSAECQQARRVPEAVIARFIDAKLHRIMQPRRHGGWSMGVVTHTAASFELGKGDASQGWVLASYGDNAHIVSCFSDEAQDEVWNANPTALVAGRLTPQGSVVSGKGGFVASGTWKSVVGADHAAWFLGTSLIEEGDQQHKICFLIPKSEARVVDDGRTVGLEGAGAKSFVLDDVIIPEHRVLQRSAVLSRKSSLAMAAVPLGVATSMLNVFADICSDTAKRGRRVSDNFATAMRISESKADIDSGVLSITAAATETMTALARGEAPTAERRALNGLKAAYAAMLAARAADRIFVAAGAKAILLTNPMQRFLLDIHHIIAQDVFKWDAAVPDYGLLRLGMTPA